MSHAWLLFVCFSTVMAEPFHVESAKKTWSAANAYCQSQYNTHLVTIVDSEMNDDIMNSIVDDSWIGYFNPNHSDVKIASNWQWISGDESSNYINWGDSSSEPNNAYGDEWCVEMRVGRNDPSFDGTWNDRGCVITFQICEFTSQRQ
eukprot:16443_1